MACGNVLESAFFVLGTSLHAYFLRVIADSSANFFSGMRWNWSCKDCRLIRKSFSKQLVDFFFIREVTLRRIRDHLELSHYYLMSLGYITTFYLLRAFLNPYFGGYFFYVFFGVLSFYWYSISIRNRGYWFVYFLAQLLTALVFIALAKTGRVYLAFFLAVVFRFVSLQISLLIIASVSSGLREIFRYFFKTKWH